MLTQSQRKSRQHPLLQYSGKGERATHWTQQATIRASNLILFKFEHISVPEERLPLLVFLKAIASGGSIPYAIRLLLDLFREGVDLSTMGISQLEELWTQTSSVSAADNDESVRAFVIFRTHFESDDWQIVRHLSCLTCTNRAANLLAKIATNNKFWEDLPEYDAHRCTCLVKAARELRDYSDIDSVAICVSREELSLELRGRHLSWSPVPDSGADVWPPALSKPSPNASSSERLIELAAGKPAPVIISRGFYSASQDKGAILVDLPESIASKRQRFCLIVGQDWRSSGGERWLAKMIKKIVGHGVIHRDPGQFGESMTPTEKRMLRFWNHILAGKEEPHPIWPE